MNDPLLIHGALAVAGEHAGRRVSVEVLHGQIVEIAPAGRAAAVSPAFDASDLLLAPGFLELQINGIAGYDFTSDPGSLWRAGAALPRHGVTTFLPTIVSAPPATIAAALAAWRAGPASEATAPGAVPLGLHLEGPFLAPARRGAHRLEHLRAPDAREAGGWSPEAGVRLVTLAPELPGALELVRELSLRGVVMAAGHSDADLARARAAVDVGVRHATHLFNAMPPLHHRAPGLAGAVLLDERVTLGLIADGEHVAAEMLDLVSRAASAARIILTSDAVAALDAPDGEYRLGDEPIFARAGQAARLGDGRLAGGTRGFDEDVRRFRAATGLSVADAIATVTRNPARLLGLEDGRGTLRRGGRADLVALTSELQVVATWIAGELAWAAEPARWTWG